MMRVRFKLLHEPHPPPLSEVGFAEGDHRVRRDGARLGGEGLPAPQTGCPCGMTLVSVVSVVSIVSDVSDVSVLKKPTCKRPATPGCRQADAPTIDTTVLRRG